MNDKSLEEQAEDMKDWQMCGCLNAPCKYSLGRGDGCSDGRPDPDEWPCLVAKAAQRARHMPAATPPPKPSGTMERALELAVESTVLRHECNSSRMTLCKRGGDYEQCLKCWKDYSISKAQQEEGK